MAISLTELLLLLFVAGLGVGLGYAWAYRYGRQQTQQVLQAQRAQSDLELVTLRERLRGLEQQQQRWLSDAQQQANQFSALRETLEQVRSERSQLAERSARIPALEEALRQSEQNGLKYQTDLADLAARLQAEQQQSQAKLNLLQEAREALSNQFKSLANDILEEKSKRFAEQNQTTLGQMLDPLKVRLQEFQGKVEQYYVVEGKERSALTQQVSQLMQLNQTLSDEARNLTQALKGSAKTQGNWGELILERVLEVSGLQRGLQYDVQESHVREDGSRAQPDVVIHLPQERHLVVDAKVSLLAYEEYMSAPDDLTRAGALRRHQDSVRNHIRGLSERNYQKLYGLQSLDFVLMFVPIEPAFILSVGQDSQLFMDAWNRNVLLVSPSTLLFVVRTVAHLWQQEAQSKNAQDIAHRGGELYDRLCAFVNDLEKVGERLRLAQDAYADALAKLSTNKGNVIRQAEMLKALGIKASKNLSPQLLERSGSDAQDTPPLP